MTPEEMCYNTKMKLDGRLKNLFYSLNTTANFGCATYLYKKYGYPNTLMEFWTKYKNDAKVGSKYNGRSMEYVALQAHRLAELDNYQESNQDYLKYIFAKVFLDTMVGMRFEKKAQEICKQNGYKIEDVTVEDDKDYGIDFKISKDDKLQYLIQVKPSTFFKGVRNESLINDRKNCFKKEKKSIEKYKVPTLYMIYDRASGEFIENGKGKKTYRLKNLLYENGQPKIMFNN